MEKERFDDKKFNATFTKLVGHFLSADILDHCSTCNNCRPRLEELKSALRIKALNGLDWTKDEELIDVLQKILEPSHTLENSGLCELPDIVAMNSKIGVIFIAQIDDRQYLIVKQLDGSTCVFKNMNDEVEMERIHERIRLAVLNNIAPPGMEEMVKIMEMIQKGGARG